MKYIRLVIILLISSMALTSCFDDTTIEDEVKETPNLVGFSNATAAVSAVSDGGEYVKTIPMRLFGPRLSEVGGPVTATISVDEDASTAEEGVHYRLESNTVTLNAEGKGNLAVFPITMLTEGIDAPLAENPVLVLNVESVSGDGSVIASGASLTVNMLYLCYADMAGTYTVTNDFCNTTFTAEISANPDGSWYLTVADGGFLHTCTSNVTLLNWGTINEVCGVIQPTNNLRFGESNGIGTILGGTWDQETGTLTMQHQDTFFNGGPFEWESTYVRQ